MAMEFEIFVWEMVGYSPKELCGGGWVEDSYGIGNAHARSAQDEGFANEIGKKSGVGARGVLCPNGNIIEFRRGIANHFVHGFDNPLRVFAHGKLVDIRNRKGDIDALCARFNGGVDVGFCGTAPSECFKAKSGRCNGFHIGHFLRSNGWRAYFYFRDSR